MTNTWCHLTFALTAKFCLSIWLIILKGSHSNFSVLVKFDKISQKRFDFDNAFDWNSIAKVVFVSSCFSKMVVTQKNFWAGKRLFKDKFYIFQANYVACVTDAWVISPRASSRSRARLAPCSNSLPIIIRVHGTRLSSYYFMYLSKMA